MAQFLVLMREDDNAWTRLEPAEQERVLRLYGAWVRDLKDSGAFVCGNPLAEGGRILRHARGEFREAAYSESKQVETGYFLIEAHDLDAATHLARGCPALLHGETVIVRPVGNT